MENIKSFSRLVKRMDELDDDSQRLLEALRWFVFREYGDGYGCVYIEAARPPEWSKAELSGHLSVLHKNGLYERIDGLFGKVKLE